MMLMKYRLNELLEEVGNSNTSIFVDKRAEEVGR